MDPIIGWLALPAVFLYLTVAFLGLILYAIYRMASRRHLLTPGETLFGVLMMLGLPILGSLAIILYTYHLENKELRRSWREREYRAAEEEIPEERLDLTELERRKQKRAARR